GSQLLLRRQVVHGTDAENRYLGQSGIAHVGSSARGQCSDFTAATTASTVKPKYLNNASAGADAPNVSMPTTWPSRPTYLRQKSVTPASMATRLRTVGGSTLSR